MRTEPTSVPMAKERRVENEGDSFGRHRRNHSPLLQHQQYRQYYDLLALPHVTKASFHSCLVKLSADS